MKQNIPKPEYPRPQMVRQNWHNLNGEWEFETDDADHGEQEAWYQNHTLKEHITVPFAYQCIRSGIGVTDFHNVVWYQRRLPEIKAEREKRYLLHFGAVDYQTKLWVNGCYAGTHTGGHTSFTFEITEYLREEGNYLTLRVEDEPENMEQPRGKQFWKQESEGIFYTGTTGIWQTVWLEEVNCNYIKTLRMTPDVDRKTIRFEILTAEKIDAVVEIEIYWQGKTMISDTVGIRKGKTVREFWLDQNLNLEWEHKSYEWTPEHPVLFDVRCTLKERSGGDILDSVDSYFAMRKISVEDGKILLNNRPYYQRLLLDQGYWRESLMTAPDDEALRQDILIAKQMGFNGVRKHQKVEEERFFYWADRLGFLVWAEFANAYLYSKEYAKNMVSEWMDAVLRDYNHPSIVAWVPLNESWGVDNIMSSEEEQAHSAAMYYLTKSLDTTRLVISNDGWNHTKSDILTIHDYECREDRLKRRYASKEAVLGDMPANRTLFSKEWKYEGQPIIVSEFGGIAYQKDADQGWGYSSAGNDEDFKNRFRAVISGVRSSPFVQGYVYTQLSDVEQEINGLLTYDRIPKVPVEEIRAILEETEEMQ